MEIKKSVFVIALLITMLLFLAIFLFGYLMDSKREETLDYRFDEIDRNIDDIQKFMLMSEVYGNDMACIAYKTKLRELDRQVWDLGIKLDQYRIASEEFQKNKYYTEQKKLFNEYEVIYLMLLKKISDSCAYDQGIISFFYRNSVDCKKCDDQSFVLTDINKEFDQEISIFSFDLDLNLTTVELLREYYDINDLPCIIVNEKKYCGIKDNKFIIDALCLETNLTVCSEN